ncbi:MAG: 16S rRNA processing protein RimM [bacterium]|nr:16S rRNA processing protein RimM [bacterium]
MTKRRPAARTTAAQTAKTPRSEPDPSLAQGELIAGRLAGLFGVRGELKLDVLTGDRTACAGGDTVRLLLAGGGQAVRVVRSLRAHGRRWLIAFEEAADANAASALIGARLIAHRDALPPLSAGEYYDHQLVGCALFDDAIGAPGGPGTVGVVARVEHWPASDVLVLEDGTLVPLVVGYEPRIDLGARRITMTLPPGLIDPRQGVSDR